MVLRKYGIGVILILVLILGWRVFAEPEPQIKLIFQSGSVDASAKAIVKNGVKFVNLQFLIRQLKVQGDWKADSGKIQLRYGDKSFELQEDQLTYSLNTTIQTLTTAPFEQESQLWFPAEFLTQLGVGEKSEDPTTLELGWAEDYLLAIENITYQGRPALVFTGSKALKFSSFLLAQPERLIIDLAGVKIHPLLDSSGVRNLWVQKVRFSQFNAQTSRIVCDLTQASSYRMISEPGNPKRLMVVFNYELQTVKLVERDGDQKIQMQTDQPAVYQVQQLSAPPRAVIDFEGATLSSTLAAINGDGKWFKRVRISQFSLTRVRVVVDLTDEHSVFKVERLPGNPQLLEIRSIQIIKAVQWRDDSPKSSALVLGGIDSPEVTFYKAKNSARLQIDLEFCQFRPEVKAPLVPENSWVKAIRLRTLGTTRVRIEMDLNYYAGYETSFDNNSRQLTIHLLKSPLVGRTIVLDAGHGGEDMGATGGLGTQEKQVNLDVALRLKELLQEAGANVLLTRTNDYFIGLFERSLVANRSNAGLFISIHSNFHPNHEVRGFEIYYYKGMDASKLLAQQIRVRSTQAMHVLDLGVKTNNFVVIRETLMPSVLLELGYLSNQLEENLMKTTAFRENAAWGLLRGIVDYYFLGEA